MLFSPVETTRLYHAAINALDFEALAGFFAIDAVYASSGIGEIAGQEAILDVKRKFGKNALLKGIDLMPQATQRDRNRQLGGHKSGE